MPVQKQPRPLPIGKVGACLVSIVIILCLVVTFHAVGAATLEKPPLGLDGGIIFKGAATNRYIPATLSSTSTVPTNLPSTGTVDAPKPAPPTNVARFTAAEVTALARKFSPQCRKLAYTGTVRWVGYRCPLYEDAEPTFTAQYLENGSWRVTKVCSINPKDNGVWYFYEDTQEFLTNRR